MLQQGTHKGDWGWMDDDSLRSSELVVLLDYLSKTVQGAGGRGILESNRQLWGMLPTKVTSGAMKAE